MRNLWFILVGGFVIYLSFSLAVEREVFELSIETLILFIVSVFAMAMLRGTALLLARFSGEGEASDDETVLAMLMGLPIIGPFITLGIALLVPFLILSVSVLLTGDMSDKPLLGLGIALIPTTIGFYYWIKGLESFANVRITTPLIPVPIIWATPIIGLFAMFCLVVHFMESA